MARFDEAGRRIELQRAIVAVARHRIVPDAPAHQIVLALEFAEELPRPFVANLLFQRRNLFFPIKVINFILVYLHHVQRIAILPYCHLLRFFLYHFCTTIYFTSENGLLCSHRFTEIQTQFNRVSHSPIMRHQK